MKKSLVLASVLLSATAFGAADSSINDLQYVPNAGTIFGSTQYGHATSEFGKTNGLYQTVGYGIADNLFADVNLSYDHSDFGSSESDGLSDVVFNGRYRLNGTANRFDLIGGLSISPAKAEVDGDEGNNFSGGHSLRLGAEYGNKSNERQWSLGAYYVHNFEAKTEYKDLDETDTSKAHGTLSFAGNLLTRIADNCFFKTYAGVNFQQEYDIESDSGDYENPSSTYLTAGGEFQHLLSQNLYINLGAAGFKNSSREASTVMRYSVGANYQF